MRLSIYTVPLLLVSTTLATDLNRVSTKPSPVSPAVRHAVRGPALAIPHGTFLRVRVNESIDTRRTRPGTTFHADLARPVVHNGVTILPKGTRFVGHVTQSKPSGRLGGRAVIALTLDSFHWNGRDYRISTSGYTLISKNHKKRSVKLIGGGSGVGAAIGAIAGGGAGALIGAAAGGVAGSAGAVITGKRQLHLPSESLVSFPVRADVRL